MPINQHDQTRLKTVQWARRSDRQYDKKRELVELYTRLNRWNRFLVRLYAWRKLVEQRIAEKRGTR